MYGVSFLSSVLLDDPATDLSPSPLTHFRLNRELRLAVHFTVLDTHCCKGPDVTDIPIN